MEFSMVGLNFAHEIQNIFVNDLNGISVGSDLMFFD